MDLLLRVLVVILALAYVYMVLIFPIHRATQQNEEILTLLRTLLREQGYSNFDIACVADNGGTKEEALRALNSADGYDLKNERANLSQIVERDRRVLEKRARRYSRIENES